MVPEQLEGDLQQKLSLLLSVVVGKTYSDKRPAVAYYCFKLAGCLLTVSCERNDYTALTIVVNCGGLLSTALHASRSRHERVACEALALLARIVRAYADADCQCERQLKMAPAEMAADLHAEASSPKGAALADLLSAVVGSATYGRKSVLDLGEGATPEEDRRAMRALLFRVQVICCTESRAQSATGWKTMTDLMRYVIDYRRGDELVTEFATQPWMFTLVRFQLTQKVIREFLVFLACWLRCLKIIYGDWSPFTSPAPHSLLYKTFVLIRKTIDRLEAEASSKVKMLIDITESVDYFIVRNSGDTQDSGYVA